MKTNFAQYIILQQSSPRSWVESLPYFSSSYFSLLYLLEGSMGSTRGSILLKRMMEQWEQRVRMRQLLRDLQARGWESRRNGLFRENCHLSWKIMPFSSLKNVDFEN